MIKKLQQNPLFVLLLPVFFVFHGFVENYSFIRFIDCGALFGVYTASAVILYGLGWLLLRNKIKAALFSSYIMSFYLFFGALHDFLHKNSSFLHKYSILLPSFVVLAALLFFYLKRRKSSFARITLFLNLLFTTYILVDGFTLAWKTTHENARRLSDYSGMPTLNVRNDSCPKPDIYFILFDDYSGNQTLKDVYHYDNSAFEHFLEQEGFQVQKRSHSNYMFTLGSMASMMNLAYLGSTHSRDSIEADDYSDLVESLGKNRVVNYLYSQGYAIVNYSPFDLPGHPTLREQRFFPVKTRLITNRTLLNYMERDLQAWIEDHFEDSTLLSGNRILEFDRTNRQFLAMTKEESNKRSDHPRFVYTHVFMPHFPFFYDSLMHRRTLHDIASNMTETKPAYYLQYLPYTNSCAIDLISTIKRNSGGKAVIIFMSDHGFRNGRDGNDIQYIFNNQNAVYFPDKDYTLFYDSISAVNEFRVLFNKLFRQNIPLLKDSIITFRNKE